MAYEPLAKLFHMNTSPDRFEEIEKLAAMRLNSESSFRTGVLGDDGEFFCMMSQELAVLSEKVLRLERKISTGLYALPLIAQAALVRGLVVDEIVNTNEIEGVHSTRKQINNIIAKHAGSERDRFHEFAQLYLDITDKKRIIPKTLRDIRAIYDRVMADESMEGIELDGELFRAGTVEVIGEGERVLHEGLYPESKINDTLEKMLVLVASPEIPSTYSAIMSHYLFEYAHPFYDGNGRTGRYLLALFLSEPLSIITSLSLSRIIAEHKGTYYRAFKAAEDPLNHGELTFFVTEMMGLIRAAQDEALEKLEEKREALDGGSIALRELADKEGLGEKAANVLYQLLQVRLFGLFPDVPLVEIAAHIGVGKQQARIYVKELQNLGLVEKTHGRPVEFALSREANKKLGIATEDE